MTFLLYALLLPLLCVVAFVGGLAWAVVLTLCSVAEICLPKRRNS